MLAVWAMVGVSRFSGQLILRLFYREDRPTYEDSEPAFRLGPLVRHKLAPDEALFSRLVEERMYGSCRGAVCGTTAKYPESAVPIQTRQSSQLRLAPRVGLEPATLRLTVAAASLPTICDGLLWR